MLRDLGLPCGPNPGRKMLHDVMTAMGEGDQSRFQHLYDKVVEMQEQAWADGGM